MAENLNSSKYRNGHDIIYIANAQLWESSDYGAYTFFNNNINNEYLYKKLYNWHTIVDTNSLCPSGWNIPSKLDWQELINYLGGNNIAGGKLKETGLLHWNSPNTDASNISGFTALPGGLISNQGLFSVLNMGGAWWSSECVNNYQAKSYVILFNNSSIFEDNYSGNYGF